jgi:hypothetical protein
MQHLHLSAGQCALVDDSVYEPLRRWSWQYMPNDRGGYAARHIWVRGQQITIYLHRMLLAARPHELVDHIDGCGLNNQRHNLRLATPSQNCANRPAPARAIPFRGVYRDKRYRSFFAQIKIEGCNIRLGTFSTMEAAARAYDRAASEAFGVFARLNFPDEIELFEQLALPLVEAEPCDFEGQAYVGPMDYYEIMHLRHWNAASGGRSFDVAGVDDLI